MFIVIVVSQWGSLVPFFFLISKFSCSFITLFPCYESGFLFLFRSSMYVVYTRLEATPAGVKFEQTAVESNDIANCKPLSNNSSVGGSVSPLPIVASTRPKKVLF